MANVFFRKGQTETAHNIYSEVVNIWNQMLKNVVKMEDSQPESALATFVDKPAAETEILGRLISIFEILSSVCTIILFKKVRQGLRLGPWRCPETNQYIRLVSDKVC